MNRNPQRGIALVITLIMLSVVTVMVVIFLGVSRRERGSVTVSADFTDAKLAADLALNRAQAEVVSRIAAYSNLLAYDLMVSTNYINPGGFRPGVSSLTNVSYNDLNGVPLRNLDQIRQNLTNLFYDPRPPVYIGSEFRYFLDLNRNGKFDTNGWMIAREPVNRYVTNVFVGDPEWIGILEHPDRPHSSSNRFVGRFAFLVAPAGKTLDLNYLHNTAKAVRNGSIIGTEGFRRNLGAGSWEINLAAFLRDLNTNFIAWGPSTYVYETNMGPSSGVAFTDALNILTYREPARPRTALELFGAKANRLTATPSDIYSDGPLMTGTLLPGGDDNPNRHWSGADSTNGRGYVSITDLFDTNRLSVFFRNRLRNPGFSTTSAYDQYTFYRLAAQLGTDSLPANRDKMNLNFDNVNTNSGLIDPALAAQMNPWTALRFFTNAARLILQSQFGNQFTPNNTGFAIPVWQNGTNQYTAEVHRALQLAANMWDSTTNRSIAGSGYPYFPSVFRPVFGGQNGNVSIVDYIEETGTNFISQPWRDLRVAGDRAKLADKANQTNNVFGVPLVIGAKKGFPNFNEFFQQTTVQVTRRLQGEKKTETDKAPAINFYQSYEVGISNYFGLEAWNSYAQAFTNDLQMLVTNRCSCLLSNTSTLTILARTNFYAVPPVSTNPVSPWPGLEFKVPIERAFVLLTNSFYNFGTHKFTLSRSPFFDRVAGFPTPQQEGWMLYMTNSVQFILTSKGRVVDFVNLDNLVSTINIGKELVGPTETLGGTQNDLASIFWQTNQASSSLLPGQPNSGITNQIYASLNTNLLSTDEWRNYSSTVGGKSAESAIDGFRAFMGLPPIFSTNVAKPPFPSMQVPFTPTRILQLRMSWQVNDPLVHYHLQDLFDPAYTDTNKVLRLTLRELPIQPEPNLGSRNPRYRPWSSANEDLARQDPMIRSSDDWNFPAIPYPGVGWLGRVHRGTPWQTVYLKSAIEPVGQWTKWSGSQNTHPTNDWWVLNQFTTAPNDNAARGLLSVNQTNVGAWSAVLGSVAVLSNNLADASVGQTKVPGYTPMFIEPGSPQLQTMVSNINATRLAQTNLPPYQKFRTLGHLLASPALTMNSPYLNVASTKQAHYGINDEVYERIPQQVLSLLKDDEPFVVIYAFGQSLKPADRSLVTAPGPYQGLCTNYQITGEYVTKTAIRYQETRQDKGKPSTYKGIVESYTVLPPE